VLDIRNFLCYKETVRLSKLEDIDNKISKNFEKVKKLLKEIIKASPDFTGNIRLNFYKGNLVSISKSEKIKT